MSGTRSDARKRLAEQQAAPDSLADKFLAYLYAQNTVNQYSRHAEPLARIAAKHYAARVRDAEAAGFQRAKEAIGETDATWALRTPSVWESPDARSIPTLLAAIGQTLATLTAADPAHATHDGAES